MGVEEQEAVVEVGVEVGDAEGSDELVGGEEGADEVGLELSEFDEDLFGTEVVVGLGLFGVVLGGDHLFAALLL